MIGIDLRMGPCSGAFGFVGHAGGSFSHVTAFGSGRICPAQLLNLVPGGVGRPHMPRYFPGNLPREKNEQKLLRAFPDRNWGFLSGKALFLSGNGAFLGKMTGISHFDL
jgi:hypothetical protein